MHPRDIHALTKVDVVAEGDTLTFVAIEFPAVIGMGFLDVNHEKFCVVLITAIEALEGANLGPEGRSGVTPKNQDHRSFATELPKLDRTFAIHRLELEIRCHVPLMHRVDPTKIPLKPPFLIEKRRGLDFTRSTAPQKKRQREYGELDFHRKISAPLMHSHTKIFKPN